MSGNDWRKFLKRDLGDLRVKRVLSEIDNKPQAKIVNGELICLLPIVDLAPVIIGLTRDNLVEQKRLLRLHCQKYARGSHFWNLAVRWEVKTYLLEAKDHSLEQAELLAAEELGLLAFMDELLQPE